MNPERKRLHSIHHAGGREFRIYWEYDEEIGKEAPDYPDLAHNPEYTDEGWRFTMSQYDDCTLFKPKEPEDAKYVECSLCAFSFFEATSLPPYERLIGLCKREELRRPDKMVNANQFN